MKKIIHPIMGKFLLSALLYFPASITFASGHFEFVVTDQVYCMVYFQKKPLKIADAKTFVLVGSIDSKYGRMDRFAKDQYYVYDGCRRMKGISPKDFDTLLGWDFVKANNKVYYTDGNQGKWVLLKGLIPKKNLFEEVSFSNGTYSSARIIKDTNYLFYQHAANRDPLIVPKADPATFEILNQYYAKDKNRIYYLSQESFAERFIPLPKADIASFQLSTESNRQHIATDKNWRYRYTVTTHKIDITPLDSPINYSR